MSARLLDSIEEGRCQSRKDLNCDSNEITTTPNTGPRTPLMGRPGMICLQAELQVRQPKSQTNPVSRHGKQDHLERGGVKRELYGVTMWVLLGLDQPAANRVAN